MKKLFLLFFLVLLFKSEAQQDSLRRFEFRRGMMYEIITTQNTVRGVVQNVTEDVVIIEDRRDHNRYEILRSGIIAAKPLSSRSIYSDFFLEENHHAHTYMFGSSSMLNPECRTYVNYQWLLLENINFSINENWTLTMNTVFLLPSSVGVKCSYKIGNDLYLGGNAFIAGSINDRKMSQLLFFGYGGLGRITKGNSNNNFSFSAGMVGFNFFTAQASSTSYRKVSVSLPFANFCYANRFHKKWAMCAEGWYIPKVNIGFAGLGMKFLKSENTSWTVGCFTNVKIANSQVVPDLRSVPIPYVSCTSNFGR